MDSDCLIKLTKSGLKEMVALHCEVMITESVEIEVVREGLAKGHADAQAVQDNIAKGKIEPLKSDLFFETGDESLIGQFSLSQCDAVATDDSRLVKKLKAHGIAFILPGLIIMRLFQTGRIDRESAIRNIDRLSGYISEDEHATVMLLLEKRI